MKRRNFIKNTGLTAGGASLLYTAPAYSESENYVNMKISDPELKNICKTCGTRYSSALLKDNKCLICLDDRQYLRNYGQQWVSYNDLKKEHSIRIKQLHQNIYKLKVLPSFGIGQRAHLLITPHGNILWDCIPFLDEATIAFIKAKGGLSAIAISHPHYYSLMNEWCKAFDCPIYIHKDDQHWVMDKSDQIVFWKGDSYSLNPQINVVHTGGHFPGSAVLRFNQRNPVLLTGDTLYLSRDMKHLSVMYSYPNVIPLSPDKLFQVFDQVKHLNFDALYGAFEWQNITSGASSILQRSIDRYKRIYQ